MKRIAFDRLAQTGFTVVELITVIVIVGILGAVALPRFFDNRVFAERGYYEELVAALRYAQSAAVGTGCPVQFEITATTYAAAQQQVLGGRCDPVDASFGQPLTLSDGRDVAGTAPGGVTASPAATMVFDALGATDLGANLAVSVGTFALVVHAQSGYVEVP